jgi:hypothetical protein
MKDPVLVKNLPQLELESVFDAKKHLSASSKIIDNVAAIVKDTNKKYSSLAHEKINV